MFDFFQAAPKITTKPVDVHIREREEATLRCNATGTPTPTISWTFGTRDITNVRNRVLSGIHVQW